MLRKQDFGTCNVDIEHIVAFEGFYLEGFFLSFCNRGVPLKALETIFKMRSFATF